MRLRPFLVGAAALVALPAGLCLFSFLQKPTLSPVLPSTDHILVEKSKHRMTLLKNGNPIRIYSVALGRGGEGDKLRSGDNKVPEGVYRIIGRNRTSAYHLSLQIGYPTPEEVREARRGGVDPGGQIMIHGIRNGLGWLGGQHRRLDWTRGCIAVTNDEIEEIWRLVPDQITIEIRA